MNFGFVKVCAATPDLKVADVDYNTNKIIEALNEGAENGARLIVFPELSVCGYTCGDLFNQKALLVSCEEGVEKIRTATKNIKALIFIGCPVRKSGRLYNCAVALNCGKILGVVPKTYLPNYGEFYERRHFSSAPDKNSTVDFAGEREVPFGTNLIFSAVGFDGFTVSAEICEDLWAPSSPSVRHCAAGADIIVNLSASDELVGKAEYRRELVKVQSAKLICGYVYCDCADGESSTDMTFSGHDIISENGKILAESKLFENGLVYADIDVEGMVEERRRMSSVYFGAEPDGYLNILFETDLQPNEITRKFSKTPFVPSEGADREKTSELILSIQSKGLKRRLSHIGCKTAVLGLSGGLDSALALLVAVRAFKALNRDLKDLICVTMPCFGTTKKTKTNAVKLAESVGATILEINISDTVRVHLEDIGQGENLDTTYENAQARMRTLTLMDIANKTGGIVIGTGDLSELALGWATYNGDHMSMYGVNCSVPKTLVKYLVKYEADKTGGECKEILDSIINTEISPELLPPSKDGKILQKTEDLIGPYILHDFFLYYAIRHGYSPRKIYFIAEKTFKEEFDGETIKKWLKNFYKRFFANQFKRSCIPDGVKVGSLSLSPRADWRMPSDAVVKIWLKEIENI